jgi:hypothetical protein
VFHEGQRNASVAPTVFNAHMLGTRAPLLPEQDFLRHSCHIYYAAVQGRVLCAGVSTPPPQPLDPAIPQQILGPPYGLRERGLLEGIQVIQSVQYDWSENPQSFEIFEVAAERIRWTLRRICATQAGSFVANSGCPSSVSTQANRFSPMR